VALRLLRNVQKQWLSKALFDHRTEAQPQQGVGMVMFCKTNMTALTFLHFDWTADAQPAKQKYPHLQLLLSQRPLQHGQRAQGRVQEQRNGVHAVCLLVGPRCNTCLQLRQMLP